MENTIENLKEVRDIKKYLQALLNKVSKTYKPNKDNELDGVYQHLVDAWTITTNKYSQMETEMSKDLPDFI